MAYSIWVSFSSACWPGFLKYSTTITTTSTVTPITATTTMTATIPPTTAPVLSLPPPLFGWSLPLGVSTYQNGENAWYSVYV